MFLTIDALALPKLRPVAARVTGRVAALLAGAFPLAAPGSRACAGERGFPTENQKGDIRSRLPTRNDGR